MAASMLASLTSLALLANMALASSSPACYAPDNSVIPWQLPCSPAGDHAVSSCCSLGDRCLENGLCQSVHTMGESTVTLYFYRGGCSHPWGQNDGEYGGCPTFCSGLEAVPANATKLPPDTVNKDLAMVGMDPCQLGHDLWKCNVGELSGVMCMEERERLYRVNGSLTAYTTLPSVMTGDTASDPNDGDPIPMFSMVAVVCSLLIIGVVVFVMYRRRCRQREAIILAAKDMEMN